MSWKLLKRFAIVLLLFMDIVFAFFIVQRRRAMMYYEETLIDSAMTVFASSGLQVDRSLLEAKKHSPYVYTGALTTDALLEISEKMADLGYLCSPGDAGGLSFFGANDTFFFGNDFSFSYKADVDVLMPSELLDHGEYLGAEPSAHADVLHTAEAFLHTYSDFSADGQRYRYAFFCDSLYAADGIYVVRMGRTIDGVPMEDGIDLVISGGAVTAAEGVLAFRAPNAKKTAENTGIMNILLAEKAYIDTLADEDAVYTVSEISYSYGLYFDADGAFYLVPLCRVSYQNGDVRTYNFVSGKLYS